MLSTRKSPQSWTYRMATSLTPGRSPTGWAVAILSGTSRGMSVSRCPIQSREQVRRGSASCARAVAATGAVSVSPEVTVQVRFATPASARFSGSDTATAGNWEGKYGTEGYWLAGVNNYRYLPSTVNIATTQPWTDYGSGVL